ncbi:MAG: hypothetical protein RIR29_757 [Actinomycetota bacterium]
MAKTDAVPQKDKYDFTKLNTLSVVSLASALTGFGVVAAIITGHISLAQIKRTGQNGRPLALAGVILGYVAIGLWLIGGAAMLGFKYWLISKGYDLGDDFGYREMGPGMMWGND